METGEEESEIKMKEQLNAARPSHACRNQDCAAVFATPAELADHINIIHAKFPCNYPKCMAKFANAAQLKKHMDTDFHLLCTNFKCEQRFSSELDMHNHLRKAHYKQLCKYQGCTAKFSNASQLKEHLEIHKTFLCIYPNCKHRFFSELDRKTHLQEAHHEQQCRHHGCTAQFANASLLKKHITQLFANKVFRQ